MKKYLFFFIAVLVVISVFVNTVFAEENGDKSIDFSVEPIFPETQLNTDVPYFYVHTKPGDTQELSVKITNFSNEILTLDITVNNATTNNQGNIEYGDPVHIIDPTLTNPVTDILKYVHDDYLVSIEPNTEKIVSFQLKNKNVHFDGIKLGSLRFIKVNDNDHAQNLIHNIGYTIGVMITEDRRDPTVGGDLSLLGIGGDIIDSLPSFYFELQNKEPKIINDLSVNIKITKDNDSSVIIEEKMADLSVAPNSNFKYPLAIGDREITPGKYMFHIDATSGNNQWEWIEELDISSSIIEKLTVESEKSSIKISKVFILIITIIILFAFISSNVYKILKK